MSNTESIVIVLQDWPEEVVQNVLGIIEDLSYVSVRGADGQMLSCTRDDRPPAYSFHADADVLDYTAERAGLL
ncbi:MAG: hypothetical protein AB7J35_00460 [Dehalococcoidia bacterium]